ncbi:hypothetical protein [Microvirga sp. VF16]|uniref:hypothetical protein n=1 Tax=Microvirga sp. VF16 TaxID=2807101 RepID=UPI00193E6CDC|nr:hypothetical protein [Microvirga sp. VF16]QRM32487.1 hypothetical protein JO965_30820 [Microvirga sp. VF16]
MSHLTALIGFLILGGVSVGAASDEGADWLAPPPPRYGFRTDDAGRCDSAARQ